MGSISLKLKVTAIALVSFLMRGCSDIPQSDGDNWTELCKARLDESNCQLTARAYGLKRMTSLRDVMLHNVDMCGVGRTSSPSKDQA